MGFWEIFIIFIVALLVIGPKQLPRLAKQLGQFIGSIPKVTGSIKEDMQKQVQLADNEARAKQAEVEYAANEKELNK